MVIPLLDPRVAAVLFGLSDFHPGPAFRYVAAVAASLMAGWACLLLWADRRPSERSGVVFLTTVPVILGLILSGVFAVRSGFITFRNMAPTFVMQGFLMISYLGSHLYPRFRKRA
jgi:hypothetical protein